MIAGFNHDDKSDGSGKAGFTFVFTDSVGKQFMYSESDLQTLRNDIESGKTYDIGWKNTSMRTWLGNSFMFELLSDLSKEIVSVDKRAPTQGSNRENTGLAAIGRCLVYLPIKPRS